MIIVIYLNFGWSHQSLYFNSFSDSSFNFSCKSCHISCTTTIYNTYLFGTETFCSADCVHRYITATDNSNFLSLKICRCSFADITEKTNCGEDTICILTFDTKFFICTCSDCNQDSVIIFTKTLDSHIFTNSFTIFNFDTCF